MAECQAVLDEIGGIDVSVEFWRPLLGLVVLASIVLCVGTASAGAPPAAEPRDTPAVVRDDGGGGAMWYLRSSNIPTCPASPVRLGFGASADVPLGMDLTGDGLDQVTVYRQQTGYGEFFVRENNLPVSLANVTRIAFGNGPTLGDLPVVGNFNPATDEDEVGVYRDSNNTFYLDDGMPSPLRFTMGNSGDIPVAGNWDDSADGSDEVGLYRPSNQTYYLRADNIPGNSTVDEFPMGASLDEPVVGDFDRDGQTTLAVHRANTGFGTFYLRNSLPGPTDATVNYGADDDNFTMGDWDGPAVDNAGCP